MKLDTLAAKMRGSHLRHFFVVGLACTLSACAAIPGANFPREPSQSVAPPAEGFTHALFNKQGKPDESAFRMLSAGIDGLAVRLEIIDRAETALDLQYYIFREDESGSLITQALLRAADRGVRVRILVDDGESVAGDEKLFSLAAHPKVQIRVFNPFNYRGHARVLRAIDFLLHKRRLDHRMHNKLLVADNAIALIGGRNIGDQYFQIDPASQFGDDDVVGYGPIVQQLSGVYDLFWNSRESIPIQALDRKHSSAAALAAMRASVPEAKKLPLFNGELDKRLASGAPLSGLLSKQDPLNWTTADLLYDSPDKADSADQDGNSAKQVYPAFAARAAHMSKELLMISPYFVPSKSELSILQKARERNVRVAFLTNSLEAAPDIVAHAGYTHSRRTLLGEGVEVHEIRARPEGAQGTGQPKRISRYGHYGLHAKMYTFDRQALFIGSLNFDQRSRHLNTEIGLILDSPAMAEAGAKRFEELSSPKNAYAVTTTGPKGTQLRWRTEVNGAVVDYSHEPARSWWQRIAMRFFALLPLDREL